MHSRVPGVINELSLSPHPSDIYLLTTEAITCPDSYPNDAPKPKLRLGFSVSLVEKVVVIVLCRIRID